ncbi:hypothetical protein LTR56_027759 [Elasticomyces elasticus]|nr:hypothetical protein LTR56_027759 [Elasticomyces elasticus]
MTSGHAAQGSIIGVTLTFAVLASVCVAMRLHTRIVTLKSPGWDDAFVTAALIFNIIYFTAMCMQVKYGMGRHAATISQNDVTKGLIWFYISVWIYYLGLGCVKLAILLQYLRIFPQVLVRRLCFALMGVVVLYTCWTVLSAIFACTPIHFFWAQGLKQQLHGTCLKRLVVWFVNASINILTDIAIVILPMPWLRALNLPKRQRIALMLVFCLGGLTCVVSICRLQGLYAIAVSPDVSWNNPLAGIWSSLEVQIGIICSCLPVLRTNVSRIFSHLMTTHSGAGAPSDRFNATGYVGGRFTRWRMDGEEGLTLREMAADGRDIHQGPGAVKWDVIKSSCVKSEWRVDSRPHVEDIHMTTTTEQRQDPRGAEMDGESVKNLI